MTPMSEWFESDDAKAKPSNVIKLPIKDRRLLNGMTVQEMKDYCREYSKAVCGDERYENG